MPVQARLEEMAEAVPGRVATCDLTVRNAGPVGDRLRFEVKGDASAWARVTPPTLELAPTSEGVVQVIFNVPRSSWPAAGAVPVDVSVLSLVQSTRPEVVQGVLRIAAFADTGANLMPRLSHGRHRAQHVLSVSNRGNAMVRARIALTRVDRGFRVHVDPTEVIVAPGRCEVARLTVTRRMPRFWGPGPTGSFELTVEADGTPPVVVDAAMRQEPGGWALRGGAALAALATSGLMWLALRLVT